ncbi:MAG: DUF1573 domain-containing protein [Alistipes sp.]|nr:DUF1573 domain-containing protein [Alistipes sp.]
MKRLISILTLLTLCFSAVGQSNNSGQTSGISFDKKEYDFGNVLRENKDYTCTFVLENKTDKPLVLLSVNTSCSCLKARYSRRPLKVGDKTPITMVLEASKMEKGIFHRVVEVHTNAGVARVVVKGNSITK